MSIQTEIEAKFLDIDPAQLRRTLEQAGAMRKYPERLMRRKNFDYPDRRLEKIGAWVRVRDEGDTHTTLSFKHVQDWDSLHGTKEISVDVGSFDAICDLLTAVGLQIKSYQETKREKWMLDDVEITLDTWPWIPMFVELEAPSEEKLREAAEKLHLDFTKAKFGSVEVVYKKHYDVTDQEIDGWQSITFVPVPDWLEIRKRTEL